MAMASTQTDTVNTFLSLKPSPPSNNNHHHTIPTNPPSSSSSQPKSLLLSLPPELRIQIYKHLLINRFTPDDPTPIPQTHTHNQKPINLALLPILTTPLPYSLPSPLHHHHHTLDTSLLTLNKQIHTESLPILYAHNTFTLTTPTHLTTFLALIGPHNTTLLRSLDIFVPWRRSEIWPWVLLLTQLSTHATGLRYLRVGWDANFEHPGGMKPGAEERGLGDNLLFVHALGGFTRLERLEIYGFFGKLWPGYLERELGGEVCWWGWRGG
ncbi:hypothetical protein BO94DRAFT_574626 [Aspergillus sclerotioniger CBS 115572]|uniref:DUF7730 domain-containing protein n=1 Tax=Aspergillus sclerotioniger CBS 115572 TaxID=1450535 RepID=A0A317WQ69_9EURO|nr:hypothetical protein BO94DRAFT_574626 [Aspergillus sclerotioniger CBS 115572]PWY88569.1 hypothetical protein BO94DRAFT_574626 [Aspergillus sclerotioniger CBS 115572]